MNRHREFIDNLWPYLTLGSETLIAEISIAWLEVTNRPIPQHEIGHALWLFGWWGPYQSKKPANAVSSIVEYVLYLEDRFSPSPVPPTGPIFSDFLSWGYMTMLQPAYPRNQREPNIQLAKDNGFKDYDTYLFNRNDNPYNEPFHVVNVVLNPDPILATLESIKAVGMRNTVWCFADQLGGLTVTEAKSILTIGIPLVDSLADRYVFALEQNESWDSEEAREIIEHLDLLTNKDRYIHWGSGINDGTSYRGIKGIYYQYEQTTVAGVKAETLDKRGKWKDAGKQFIAGEFPFEVVRDNPQRARQLGEAVNDLVDGRANG